MVFGPCLQMCAEFLRLTNVNVVDSLQEMLHKYGSVIVSVIQEKANVKSELLLGQIERLKAAKSNESGRG